MNQDDFKEPIDIFFDSWQPKWNWIKVTLLRFQEAEEVIYKNTSYWVFLGCVESENNELRIENGAICKFWFSKKMFRSEIQRHLRINQIDWGNPLDITVEIKRPSKFLLIMRNLTYTSSIGKIL